MGSVTGKASCPSSSVGSLHSCGLVVSASHPDSPLLLRPPHPGRWLSFSIRANTWRRSDERPLLTTRQEPLPSSPMQVLRAQQFSEKVRYNPIYFLHQDPVCPQHGAEKCGPHFQEPQCPPHQERLQDTRPLGQVRAVSGSGILRGPE